MRGRFALKQTTRKPGVPSTAPRTTRTRSTSSAYTSVTCGVQRFTRRARRRCCQCTYRITHPRKIRARQTRARTPFTSRRLEWPTVTPTSPRQQARPASSLRRCVPTSTGTTDGTCLRSAASTWPTVRGGAASCQSTCLAPSFAPTWDTSAATSLGSRWSPAASRRAHGPRCCCTTC